MSDTKKPYEPNSNDASVQKSLKRFGLPTGIIAILMLIFSYLPEAQQDQVADFFTFWGDQDTVMVDPSEEVRIDKLTNYLPADAKALIDHDFFKLSYSEKDEQAEWVAYELKGANLRSFSFERRSSFRKDPKVSTGSANPRDYTNSGYDRGHLAPAADMAYSDGAMRASFYMSNVSPQQPGFNRGIWKELEEQTREWAKKSDHLYVVTGPVLSQRAQRRLDGNVKAPASFYKVLLDLKLHRPKATAFLMPNKSSDERLTSYMVSIDSVEALTGIDFFPELPDGMERELESSSFVDKWPYNEERYQLRIGLWNKQAAMAVLSKSFE